MPDVAHSMLSPDLVAKAERLGLAQWWRESNANFARRVRDAPDTDELARFWGAAWLDEAARKGY